jgi:uncharacterized coiled-coil protein SlyX
MTADLEQRLEALETRLSFIDDLAGTLNASVADHDRRLAALAAELERLRQDLATVGSGIADSGNEPPPHY